jgi:hypothetical protein
MLTKLVFSALSSDDTDGDPSVILPAIQALHPAVTNLDNGLKHKYLSLMSLLDDLSDDWAVKKIEYVKYARTPENIIIKDLDLPFVQIAQSQSIERVNTSDGRHFESEITISAMTNAAEAGSSELVGNIANRIRYILEPQNRLGNYGHYCSHPYAFGLSSFSLHFKQIALWEANHVKLVYKARYVFI